MKVNHRQSEEGSAGVKLVAVLVVLFLVAHAGYNYIPVAYNGENFKTEMHAAVLQGSTLPPSAGNKAVATKTRLQKLASVNELPPDAKIDVKEVNGSVEATVSYTQNVNILPFGIYTYDYVFNNKSGVNDFLTKK